MALLGGAGHVADLAARYLRISALGLPFALIALAGQGCLRGIGGPAHAARDPRRRQRRRTSCSRSCSSTGSTWGLDGSRAGTVIAQLGMGAAFACAAAARARRSRRPRRGAASARWRRSAARSSCARRRCWARSSSPARCCARFGAPSLGAHQIAFQLFIFLALVLDAIAIAGQVLVGRMLGAADGDGARAAARRMIGWSLARRAGPRRRAAGAPRRRSRGVHRRPRVIEQAQALWPLFALMQPAGAVVFALDGILIGAGDTRYLAGAMASRARCLRAARAVGGDLPGRVVGAAGAHGRAPARRASASSDAAGRSSAPRA